MPIDAISVMCAQLTRDLLAIAKFMLTPRYIHSIVSYRISAQVKDDLNCCSSK